MTIPDPARAARLTANEFNTETLTIWAQGKFTDNAGAELARQLLDCRAHVETLEREKAELRDATGNNFSNAMKNLARAERAEQENARLTAEVADAKSEAKDIESLARRTLKAEQQRDAAHAALKEIAEPRNFSGTLLNYALCADLMTHVASAVVGDSAEDRERSRLAAMSYRAALAASAPPHRSGCPALIGKPRGVCTCQPAPAQETER